MLGDIKKLVNLLNDLDMSYEELYFIYMIQLYKNDKRLHDTVFTKSFELYYEKNKNNYDYAKVLEKAERLGYIINTNDVTSNIILFNKIAITGKFKSIFIIDIDVCWKEVIETYPSKIWVKDGFFSSFGQSRPGGDLKKDYYNLVTKGGDRTLHLQFLHFVDVFYEGERRETTKTGAMKLEKWIYSWEELKITLQEEIEGKSDLQYQITF